MRRPHEEPFSLFGFQSLIMGVTGVMILLTLLLVLDLIQRKTNEVDVEQTPRSSAVASTATLEAQVNELRRTLQQEQQFLVDFATLSATSLDDERNQLDEQAARLRAELAQLQEDVELNEQASERLTTSADDEAETEVQTLKERLDELRLALNSLRSRQQVVFNPAKDAAKTAWLVDLSDDAIKAIKPGRQKNNTVFETADPLNAIDEFVAWTGALDPENDYFVLLVRPKGVSRYRELYQRLGDLHYDIGIDLIDDGTAIVNQSDFAIAP